MLINDLRNDYKQLAEKEKTTLKSIAEKLGLKSPSMTRDIRKFNDRYITLVEALGYDVKVVYVKRNENQNG